jgi:hypothetical protein
MLESLPMWTGIRSLLIIAGLVCLASRWALSAQNRFEKLAPQVDAPDTGPVGFRSQKPRPTTQFDLALAQREYSAAYLASHEC